MEGRFKQMKENVNYPGIHNRLKEKGVKNKKYGN